MILLAIWGPKQQQEQQPSALRASQERCEVVGLTHRWSQRRLTLTVPLARAAVIPAVAQLLVAASERRVWICGSR